MKEIAWHDRVATNENTDTAGTVEELYQAFKARLLRELRVRPGGIDHHWHQLEEAPAGREERT